MKTAPRCFTLATALMAYTLALPLQAQDKAIIQLPSPALAKVASPEASKPAQASEAALGPRTHVKLEKGSMRDVVALLSATFPGVNFVLDPSLTSAAFLPVALDMRDVCLDEILEAISSVTSAFMTETYAMPWEIRKVNAKLVIIKPLKKATPDVEMRFIVVPYSLSMYLQNCSSNEVSVAMQGLENTIEEAVLMLNAVNPSEEVRPPSLRFNAATQILIVAGQEEAVHVAEQIINMLRNNTAVVPNPPACSSPAPKSPNPEPSAK